MAKRAGMALRKLGWHQESWSGTKRAEVVLAVPVIFCKVVSRIHYSIRSFLYIRRSLLTEALLGPNKYTVGQLDMTNMSREYVDLFFWRPFCLLIQKRFF